MTVAKVLLMMGCPEVPIQTSIALYLSHKLTNTGFDVTVAGTGAATQLLKVSDSDGYYAKKLANLDNTIEDIIEKKADFDICFAFMHNDAGMTYAATMSAISQGKLYSIVFGRNAEALAETIEFDCDKIVAKDVHNPVRLKNKLDKVVEEIVK
ncbi:MULTISPECIES: DUF1890 domain-containing protein [unclassified Methanosarcina]|uniref:DUF1890 domain-containing protein n=1 Tax=unclassified Methanosarcina TaxID=2644672 RepID=UPI000615D515|nr:MULTISPECIES: DUF1890 domain-containing protein [unclassified Methanosarcina]AKB20165.1 hypothetical protein MSWHS_3302 [Methanosarcina sp. WWM596]AKB23364.1 hypothetical protein MSWH1_3093 [Methanosarcina sp. WH1]